MEAAMRITKAHDLGRYLRERRRDLGKTQAEIAASAGVSRRWLSDLEAGKPTAEIGLVIKTLYALDLVLQVVPAEDIKPAGVDLDDLLRSLDIRRG